MRLSRYVHICLYVYAQIETKTYVSVRKLTEHLEFLGYIVHYCIFIEYLPRVPEIQVPLFKNVSVSDSFTDCVITLWIISCKHTRSVLNQRSYHWSLIGRIDHFQTLFQPAELMKCLTQGKTNKQTKKNLIYISRVEIKLYFKRLNKVIEKKEVFYQSVDTTPLP